MTLSGVSREGNGSMGCLQLVADLLNNALVEDGSVDTAGGKESGIIGKLQ